MSGKNKSERYAQNRTDTIIGAGVRVNGDMTFTGVLRIQGNILGDVSCDDDSNGTIVVDKSGNVTGTIKAPHIVISGHVNGPVDSSESIEIQPGACLGGDANYKAIEVHAGGVIEGLLTPRVFMDRDGLNQEQPIQVIEPPPDKEYAVPLADPAPAGNRFGERFGRARKIGGAVTLLIALVAVVLVNRNPTPVTPPGADVALKPSSSMNEDSSARSSPVGGSGLQDGPRAVTGNAVPPAPSSDAATKSVIQAPSSDLPEMDAEKVAIVQGVNPSKPAGVFSVISNEPSVLFRKKREDRADGTRIDIAKGAAISIAIANNEIFRVAEGRDITIFYQGRKVAPRIIDSGTWMSFVPQSAGEASDKE